MNEPALILSNKTSIQATTVVPSYLLGAMGFGPILGMSTLNASAQGNFIKPADIKSIMNCYPTLQSAVGASLVPTPPPSVPPSPTVLTEPVAVPSVITLDTSNSNC
jgi:hypothetical protein